jgi:bacteriocin-like protein
MKIALDKARELSAKELDQVSGGGSVYGGTVGTPGWVNPTPKPHKPGH